MRPDVTPWFVAIGASGGEGLADIRDLLEAIPAPIGAVLLVVLHRPWDQASNLRDVLARACPHPILIADEGGRFERGTVYIGEPSQHLTLAARSFGQAYRNRTIDLLFRSVADHGGGRVIGVILSGSLDDGARGLAAIHAAGGLTMVLTPYHPARRGVPENAIAYDGPIDLVGASPEIARAIVEAVRR